MGVTENWEQTLPRFPQAAKNPSGVWTKGTVITRQGEIIKRKVLDLCWFRFVLIMEKRGAGGMLLKIAEASPYF
jgi:hypothetical protein